MRGYLDETLFDLVDREEVTYKPFWNVSIERFYQDDVLGNSHHVGYALHIVSETDDSYSPGRTIRVRHEFLIPPATYSRDTWIAWLFDRYRDVETHEAGEFFRIGGERVFAPHHGNGEDPYRVYQIGTTEQAHKRAGED